MPRAFMTTKRQSLLRHGISTLCTKHGEINYEKNPLRFIRTCTQYAKNKTIVIIKTEKKTACQAVNM